MRKLNPKWLWFAGFSALFAALAAHVFWGAWSTDFAPVMPDDSITHPTSAAGVWADYFRNVFTTFKIQPADVLWSGLLVSPYFCQELKYAVALFCASLGLAYFLRGRGLAPLASYGAGLLLGFCGYWCTLFSAGHGGWFIWMTYGIFAFGLADRAVRGNRLRHWILLGVIVAWAGYQQQDLWLLFSVFTTAYFVWCCVRERKLPWKGALIALAAFAVVFAPSVSGSLGVLKGRQEQMAKGENITDKKASESDKSWEFVTNWSMPPEDTLEFFIPRVHGDTSCPFVLSINGPKGVKPYTGALGRPMNAKQGNYRQHSLYVGWITCLLSLLGIVCGVRSLKQSNNQTTNQSNNRDILFFFVASLVFYSLSLGRYFEPAYRVVFALPFGDLIRCPVKWHHLTELCLCVLAGFGIEALISLLSRVLSLRSFALPIVGVVVLWGAVDLATEAHRFCAPVNVAPARRMNASMQMTVLQRQQFQDPQVDAMRRAGRIVSLANYLGNPDYFLVGVLEPSKP